MTAPRTEGRVRPPAMRSILFYLALSEMMVTPGFPFLEANIQIRRQGGGKDWALRMLASGSFEALFDVARPEVDMAVVNPSGALTMAYRFCRGLDACKAWIPWEEPGEPLPLAIMCRDTPATPMDVPLHPGAERYWREAGYLT